MSKKYPKLEQGPRPHTWEASVSLLDEFKALNNRHYLIVDIGFSQERQLASYIHDWLTTAPSDAVLHYVATLRHAIEGVPCLPGLHPVIYLQGRVKIYYYYGPVDEVFAYLLYPVDLWFLSEPISIEIYQYHSHAKTKTYKSACYAFSTKPYLPAKKSPWYQGEKQASSKKSCLIIGAGFAGAYLARTLANASWHVKVIDRAKKPASLGSGNRYSLLYPSLPRHQAPLPDLLHLSYGFAMRLYQDYLKVCPHVMEEITLWQEHSVSDALIESFVDANPHWIQKDSARGLYFKSVMVDMPAFCEHLLNHDNIEFIGEQDINEIHYQDECWQVGDLKAPHLILANGYLANQFKQTDWLGVKGIKGQMSHVSGFYNDKTAYCQQGHFLPMRNGRHALGASYTTLWQDLQCDSHADEKNLANWRDFFHQELKLVGHWAGIRGVSLDHLPIVGPIPDKNEFLKTFAIWQHHANHAPPNLMPNLQGLYAFTGFGSRGLLTIPLLSELMLSMLQNQALMLGDSLLKALSPARFLRKSLSQGKSVD